MKVLVVGHGLAGANIAWECHKRQFDVTIVDNYQKYAASSAAAGLMNPITGRKFNKTWLAEKIFPFANERYRELEEAYAASFLKETIIIRVLTDTASENNWMVSSKDSYSGKIMKWERHPEKYHIDMKGVQSIGLTDNCMLLDIPTFLQVSRKFYQEKGLIKEKEFDYQELACVDDGIIYQSVKYDKVIFCEGYQAINNPYFPKEVFELAKGEALIIHAPELKMEYPTKHHLFFSPLSNGHYWIGSTYEWDTLNPDPSEKKRVNLETELQKILKVPYKVIKHLSGIRPTTRDRRPIIGSSKKHSSIYFFNGLGTKGSSLAPFFSNHLLEHLEGHTALMPEVDAQRTIAK